VFENAENEATWAPEVSSYADYHRKLYAQEYFTSETENYFHMYKHIITQTRGGKHNGVMIVLDPNLNESFCSSQIGDGFTVFCS